MDSLSSGPNGNEGGFGRRPGRFADERQSSGPVGGIPTSIDQSRLPTCAPYTAFIGNLPFDVTELDIRTFMQMRNIPAGSVLNVKLPRDTVENKSRGFGYVEFSSCEDLTRALLASNQFSIKNRVVRVDLSDSKPQNDREMRPAESSKNWRDGSGMGAGFGTPRASMNREQEGREARPVSAAESSRNWRDGGAGLERPAVFARREHESRPAPAASTAVEPVRNWRETAKPVEKCATEEPVKKVAGTVAAASPVPVSKVPSGSWRREN